MFLAVRKRNTQPRLNSICFIRCGFVVQQAVQQNPQQIYNYSKTAYPV